MVNVRPAAVADAFYPGTAPQLRGEVDRLLKAAGHKHDRAPRALIVPHAGLVYSGAGQAAAYAGLGNRSASIRRVVLLGPPHRVAVDGLGLSTAAAFATPLGEVRVDGVAVETLLQHPRATIATAAHEPEHALEVQLPFLQTVLADFAIVPVLVGELAAAQVAGVLEPWWDDAETLFVISTDLSHFLDYEEACARDATTDRTILALDAAQLGPHQACGYAALNGVLHLAAQRAARIERLALFNSGDTAGDRARVVGYGAYAIY